MSNKKYWRLFAVASVPLLLLGILTSTLLFPRDSDSHWVCKPFSGGGYENCERFDEKAWWDIVGARELTPEKLFGVEWSPWQSWEIHRLNVLASERSYTDFRVNDVMSYAGASLEQERFLNQLEGMKASVTFTENTNDAIIYNEELILTCNQLGIKGQNRYEAVCGGRGWGGVFELQNLNQDRSPIFKLEESLNAMKSNETIFTVFYYIAAWPMFIYGFFFVTAIVVIFRRAARFVNAD